VDCCAMLDPIAESAVDAGAVAVFAVQGTKSAVRAMIMADGSLVRVSPVDAMAVWPVQRVTMLVVEHYALAPAEMQCRVHTSCNRVFRLSGEVSSEALPTLLRLESSLTLG
jgi:hypothetical protein